MTAELVCAATDPAWLEQRREGITATDIVTIAGLVTWDSPWALYHRKLGLLPEPEQSDRMRLGLWLQEAVAEKWAADRADLWAEDDGSALNYLGYELGGLYRSAARPWQMATPDYVRLHMMGGNDATLECKTWDERQGKHEWGPDGSDIMPRKVRVQSLWQMDTLGVGTGHVAVVFLPSGEFRSYTIRHDEQNCLRASDVYDVGCRACDDIQGLRDLGFGFWSRILTRRPPDLDGLEVTTDALRYLHPAPIDSPAPIEPYLVRDFDAAGLVRKGADERYREIQNKIRDAMGDATIATAHGATVFRRTIGKRAGYTVPPGETDILRRIGKDKDGD